MRPFELNQDVTAERVLFTSVCSISKLGALIKREVSSANITDLQSSFDGRSFTKAMKSVGPKIEPWGTPVVTGRYSDLCSPTSVS